MKERGTDVSLEAAAPSAQDVAHVRHSVERERRPVGMLAYVATEEGVLDDEVEKRPHVLVRSELIVEEGDGSLAVEASGRSERVDEGWQVQMAELGLEHKANER